MSYYDRFIEWRERHISEKNLVLILSFFVGCFSAAAAVLLHGFIHLIQNFIQTVLTHLEHAYLVGCAESVLDTAKNSV